MRKDEKMTERAAKAAPTHARMKIGEQILLTPAEAAEITRLSVSTVRQYIASGIMPVTRLGRRTFVRKADLVRWIEENTTRGR